jgi:hypothetical protein
MPKRCFGLPLLYMMIGIQPASHAQVLTAQYDNFQSLSEVGFEDVSLSGDACTFRNSRFEKLFQSAL